MIKTRIKNGFTLLEVIFGVFVFVVGVLGVYIAIQTFYETANYHTSRLTAMYLAQEGIEIVRNIRDKNILASLNGAGTWSDGLAPNSYQADYNDPSLTSLGGSASNTSLNIENDTGFYSYNGAVISKYKRTITISDLGADGKKITVQVDWGKGNVSIDSYLYDYF